MKKFLIAILLLLAVSPAHAAERESAYDRIMRTQTIRCGYFLFPPISMKDPKTGALSGISVDIFNKAAANLGLKVQWAEEASFEGLIPGLQTRRYDVVCTPMWPTAARAREVQFTVPEFYAGLGVWVRAKEQRFDHNLAAIDNSGVTISGVDGQIEQAVHDEQFPHAKMLSLPGGTDFSQSMLNVVTGKADVTFVDRSAGALFEAAHPGLLKDIARDKPLRVFPSALVVGGGEWRLKNMLDQALMELQNTGFLDRTLARQDPKQFFLPVAQPYGVR